MFGEHQGEATWKVPGPGTGTQATMPDSTARRRGVPAAKLGRTGPSDSRLSELASPVVAHPWRSPNSQPGRALSRGRVRRTRGHVCQGTCTEGGPVLHIRRETYPSESQGSRPGPLGSPVLHTNPKQ